MDLTTIAIILIGIIVNMVMPFIINFLIGLNIDMHNNYNLRMAIYAETVQKKLKKNGIRFGVIKFLLPYASILDLFLKMNAMDKFLKQHPDQDALDWCIERAKKEIELGRPIL